MCYLLAHFKDNDIFFFKSKSIWYLLDDDMSYEIPAVNVKLVRGKKTTFCAQEESVVHCRREKSGPTLLTTYDRCVYFRYLAGTFFFGHFILCYSERENGEKALSTAVFLAEVHLMPMMHSGFLV